MKTEFRLAEELKTMMSEMPLDDISVSALAKRCKVNRQTFYYHFHDIYDLLALVFLNERIEKSHKITNPHDLIESIFKYYCKNAAFIDATIDSAGRDLFGEFINNICYTSFMKMILEADSEKCLTLSERKNVARFYSYAFANVITFYFLSNKNKTLESLLKCFNFLPNDFITKIIKNHSK
jgi:AcrR family transcriptional regulator